MGERKGTNKYYPPDFDPQKHRNLAGYTGQHPLRERARKLHMGILIIRFEMPYNIWCDGCNNHVGMGVRYNAEKSKVGMYYTTPIYKFRMKCHLCDNHIEMKTDPANHDYVIISGARRKEQRWDPKDNEQIVTDDKEDIKKMASNAMYKLEHGIDDKQKIKVAAPTIGQLAQMQDGKRDDYLLNKLARGQFREKKKQIQTAKNKDAALLERSSLDLQLVAETEDDRRMAEMLKYRTVVSYDEKQKKTRDDIMSQSIFSSIPSKSKEAATPSSASSTTNSSTSSTGSKDKHIINLQKQISKTSSKQQSFSLTKREDSNNRRNKQLQLGIVRKASAKPETNSSERCEDTVETKIQVINREMIRTEPTDVHGAKDEGYKQLEKSTQEVPNCERLQNQATSDCNSQSDRTLHEDKIDSDTNNESLSGEQTHDRLSVKELAVDTSLQALAGMYNTSSDSDGDSNT